MNRKTTEEERFKNQLDVARRILLTLSEEVTDPLTWRQTYQRVLGSFTDDEVLTIMLFANSYGETGSTGESAGARELLKGDWEKLTKEERYVRLLQAFVPITSALAKSISTYESCRVFMHDIMIIAYLEREDRLGHDVVDDDGHPVSNHDSYDTFSKAW